MNPAERRTLQTNRVNLVNNLEAIDILDYLLEDGVLTENDCELITNGKTRKERAQLLLTLLPTRGPGAYGSFQRALELGKYDFLGELFTGLTQEESTNTGKIQTGHENDFQICLNIISRCKNLVFQECLKEHFFVLIDNVEPQDIVDHFYQEQLISDDTIELVRIGKTRRQRCLVFFEELSKCSSENILTVLQNSLKKKYKFISELLGKPSERKITEDIHENRTKSIKPKATESYDQDPTKLKVARSGNSRLTDETHETLPPFSDFTTGASKSEYQNETSICTEHPRKTCNNKLLSFDHSRTPALFRNDTLFCSEHSGKPRDYQPLSVENSQNPSCTTTCLKPVKESQCQRQSCEREPSLFCDNTHKKCEQNLNLAKQSSDQSTTLSTRNSWTNMQSTDISNENVTDGTAIMNATHRVKPMMQETTRKHKPVLFNLPSTDSETESYLPSKPRRKLKSKKIAENENENCHDKTFMKTGGKTENNEVVNASLSNMPSTNIWSYQPGGTDVSLSGRHLVVTFNYLSTLINQGNFDKFELFSSNLQRRYSKDPDMSCLLGYLHASRDLFKTDFDSAKKHIDKAVEIVPKTSNPKYFTLELFTSKTRMYITQKKLEKLEKALDDAKMIIEMDPLGCTGRAAGWLYMNDARNCTAQIGILNFRNSKAITSYTKLHKRAKASFQKALSNFQRDGGKDGPFGFGYALCRLAILLLRCDDSGRTMDILIPPEEDIKLAGGYLLKLEDSDVAIPKILEMHFALAKCDYQFRRKNTIRALEYAEQAYVIASDLKLLEFTEHANNRCLFLRKHSPGFTIDDVTEEEFNSILFGSSSDVLSD